MLQSAILITSVLFAFEIEPKNNPMFADCDACTSTEIALRIRRVPGAPEAPEVSSYKI